MFNLSEFKSRVITPARQTLFKVHISLPATSIPDFEFLCEASSVPAVQVPAYQIHYQGRQIQYSGDKVYSAWSTQVICEEGNFTRAQFENWFELINGTRSGVRDGQFGTSLDYKGVAEIVQQTQTGDEPETARYFVEGMFPTNLDEMKLAWSETDDYLRFGVTFMYDWWSTLATPE